MGEIVCERRDGMGTTEQTVGQDTVGKGAGSSTGNSRDGQMTPYDEMVDGVNRTNDRRGREIAVGNEKSRVSCSRPVPFPSRLLPRVSLNFTKFAKMEKILFLLLG